ncbi:MAG: hypothetical protein NTW19_06580 [Planctomycetota bacterium]|nr:hypothetical protein [Planctomycetota bacterium]
MKRRWNNDGNKWTTDGRKITAPEALDAIRRCLEKEGWIIVVHWFYYGASAPHRFVLEDFEEFTAYLEAHASAGDAVDVWSFEAVCREDNLLASGKCPDDDGRVPEGGSY